MGILFGRLWAIVCKPNKSRVPKPPVSPKKSFTVDSFFRISPIRAGPLFSLTAMIRFLREGMLKTMGNMIMCPQCSSLAPLAKFRRAGSVVCSYCGATSFNRMKPSVSGRIISHGIPAFGTLHSPTRLLVPRLAKVIGHSWRIRIAGMATSVGMYMKGERAPLAYRTWWIVKLLRDRQNIAPLTTNGTC